ncbi:protein-L-isoaspartate(D-aspartate) O-methyltransferase [Marinomonas sp. MED121]|uniref:protein-L-isoaspartate(D-aspartate) O-methyltransferase n=1 Tax=Marinomonas sp. MED121 TaxID=314277 RepID=UPI0002FA0AC9|nr:protein-L-isoaspartate(D-aspartate) O-methyltransferase [Marinomonas sp. MED121]
MNSLQSLVKNSESRASGMINELRRLGIENEALLSKMAELPRHLFVEPAFSHLAYSSTPLPIGHNQTISQPFTVARMTQWLLQYARLGRVLEVGTGSGYQTALLAHFFNKVHTIERKQALHEMAKQRLGQLQINNVEYLYGDANKGWPTRVALDAIIVTAMVNKVPTALLENLKEGGVLIMPIEDTVSCVACWIKEGTKWKRLDDELAHFVPLLEGLEDE